MLATPKPGSSEAAIVEALRNEPFDRTEVFFQNAKSLNDPMNSFEDADFWSVQALLLMSIYMLTKSKRNAAFALLGMYMGPAMPKTLSLTTSRHGCTKCPVSRLAP